MLPAPPLDKELVLVPNKDGMFDPDLRESAWYRKYTETLEERCRAFALGVLNERDKLDRLAREAVASYGDPSADKSHVAREIEWRMKNIGNAVERLPTQKGYFAFGDIESL